MGNMKYNQIAMPNLLNDVDLILLECVAFDKFSMIACQSLGFNGLKRKHRRNARYYMNCALSHENEAFDGPMVKLMNNFPQINYGTSDIVVHLQDWTNMMDNAINQLGELNNAYIEYTGIGCKTAEKAIKHMIKTREKTRRWHARFINTESKHDMYDLDDSIHKKEKAKECVEMEHFHKGGY